MFALNVHKIYVILILYKKLFSNSQKTDSELGYKLFFKYLSRKFSKLSYNHNFFVDKIKDKELLPIVGCYL